MSDRIRRILDEAENEPYVEMAREAIRTPAIAPLPEDEDGELKVADALRQEAKRDPSITELAIRYGKRLGEMGQLRLYAGLLNIDGDMPTDVINAVLESPNMPVVMQTSDRMRKAIEHIADDPRNVELCRALGFDEARIEEELAKARGEDKD